MIGEVIRAITVPMILVLLGLGGCGSSSEETVPGGADADAVDVIKQWSDELRAGDVQEASERFAIPSVVQNGTPPVSLGNRRQIEAFNRSLPCGARLTEAIASGPYTIATFVLTERPGPGECGDGVGETAKTAFVIHRGLIVEWRRVVDIPGGEPTATGPLV